MNRSGAAIALVVIAAVAAGVFVVYRARGTASGNELTVRNQSGVSVRVDLIQAGSHVAAPGATTIAAGTTRTVSGSAGAAIQAVRFSLLEAGGPAYECDWLEALTHHPLLVNDHGPDCTARPVSN